ncbi:hypothetical protein [Nannocystis punicea]|uniref:Uncharacterized protein n=1 Tax=Nannocystis punicea TaxID=2995304 RepID=A0ABY7GS59_9BACT|nr:hypothetical protein [Nannocystis poenicansa]WAS89801.1 hypothetical protein O0S08_26720 [Nannocystis poenicansa]
MFSCERHGNHGIHGICRHVLDACKNDRPIVLIAVLWIAETWICPDCKRTLEQVLSATVDDKVVFRRTAEVMQAWCPGCIEAWRERHGLSPEPWDVDLLIPSLT